MPSLRIQVDNFKWSPIPLFFCYYNHILKKNFLFTPLSLSLGYILLLYYVTTNDYVVIRIDEFTLRMGSFFPIVLLCVCMCAVNTLHRHSSTFKFMRQFMFFLPSSMENIPTP